MGLNMGKGKLQDFLSRLPLIGPILYFVFLYSQISRTPADWTRDFLDRLNSPVFITLLPELLFSAASAYPVI